MARTVFDHTYIKITYGQPSMRGRKIFGHLVPYGDIWRLGANETTEITVTDTLEFGGVVLPAGTYALYAIPEPHQWTIIMSKGLGLWGAFSYNSAMDLRRVTVPVTTTEDTFESLLIDFATTGLPENHLRIRWENTQILIPIRFPEE